MRNGSFEIVTGTQIADDYAYVKEDGRYCLTHIPTGVLITSSRKAGALKLLCTEPEFFEEFDPQRVLNATFRFWNKYGWQDENIHL